MPTWLYVISSTYLNLMKIVHFVSFFAFPVACITHVFNHTMVGLMINPVYGPISQQPGPIKICQATRYLWSYIRNYNRIHYQCLYTSPIP